MSRKSRRRRDTGEPHQVRSEHEAGKVLRILDDLDIEAGREPITVGDHELARRELDALAQPPTRRAP